MERPAIAGATSGPVALALTRQKLPTLPGTTELAREGVRRGGYVLREAAGGTPELILIGTGSELQLCFEAAEDLEADGVPTRVVSLPCWERFEAQDQAYRDSVLPPSVKKRVTVESGISLGWERYAGDEGAIIGIDHFGASAPAGTIFENFGFTEARVTEVGWKVAREGLRRAPADAPRPHGDHPTIARASRVSIARRAPTRVTAEVLRCASRSPRTTPVPRSRTSCSRSWRASPAGEHELIDLGGDGSDPQDDYPDFAWLVGQAIQTGHADRGILVCGSGVGASIAVNKMRGVRAGLCHDAYSAHQGVEHDDMNVLALGARVIGIEPATECAMAFLGAEFSGEARHQRRVDKVLAIEADSMGPGD